jgi:hypothetical protein
MKDAYVIFTQFWWFYASTLYKHTPVTGEAPFSPSFMGQPFEAGHNFSPDKVRQREYRVF